MIGFAVGLVANLARPEGEMMHVVMAVARGVVWGVSAVAGGVAAVMRICHGEDYTERTARPMEPTTTVATQATQASLFPPSYYVSLFSLFALLPSSHQSHM